MNTQPKIAILLATYNGAEYLSAQLDSILAQTYSNYIVVMRDDCSSDKTIAILQNYQLRYPDKFHLVTAETTNKGASASFSCLIEYTLDHKEPLGLQAAYMMFCDQDDVWFVDKIEREVSAMLTAEAGNLKMPVLIHSDLEVVSEKLEQIAPSFIHYQGLEIERNCFNNMVISNLVTGCTTLINESLAVKASPVSKQAIMHDWWLALVAAAFGKVVFLDQPLVHYRQHSRNTIGAKEFAKLPAVSMSLLQRLLTRKPNDHLFEVARQAREFQDRFGAQLTLHQRNGLRIATGLRVRTGILQRILYRVARRY